MKKLILSLMLLTLAISACGKKQEEVSSSPTTTPFEEVEKVDIEINDYVDPTPTPAQSPDTIQDSQTTPTASDSQSTQQETKTPANTDTNNSQTGTAQNNESSAVTQSQDSTKYTQPESNAVDLSNKIICIDAGHGAFSATVNEAISPNSSATKPANKEGTRGSQYTEDEITLSVALKVKVLLEDCGATVLMTRTDENSTMTNKERAVFANDNNADIVIKLHADGTQEGGSGMTMLVPGYKYITDNELLSDSKRLGRAIINNAVKLTGARNRGVYTNTQMTGFNWSEVPVVLFEMGFMTNRNDEKKLADSEYQDKIAQGIFNGIIEYYK